jgi:predicted DNA-binding transcriptional regulator YafY
MPRNFIYRVRTIDRLISRKGTGTSEDLARHLGVSKRTAQELITIMKELGAPIYFDKLRKSYCYKFDGSFEISFNSTK